MIEHPTYADTDIPMLIGDIVSYENNIYRITSIGNTAIGIIVSGTAPTGQSFSTDSYDDIAKVSKERAEAYYNPRNADVWNKAFEIAKEAHANICEIKLSSPNTLATCLPIYLFGLVPEDIDTENIAPWAVCSIHPTTVRSVEIKAIDKQYSAPHRMLKFAENLVTAYESNQLEVSSPSLWLVPRAGNKIVYWYATKLDNACRRLEDTYHEYELVPQDIATHITDMCDMFQDGLPEMLGNFSQKRSLEWWREYAAELAYATKQAKPVFRMDPRSVTPDSCPGFLPANETARTLAKNIDATPIPGDGTPTDVPQTQPQP